MDFYRVNKVLVYFGLLPVILYLYKGGFLYLGLLFIPPIIGLAVKPSYRVLGISFIVSSLLFSLDSSSILISILGLLFSIPSFRLRYLPLIGLVSAIILPLFLHTQLLIPLLVSIGSALSLFDRPYDPSIVFTLAIPYYLLQILFLVIYSFYTSQSIVSALNLLGSLGKYAYLGFAVVFITFVLYVLRKDYLVHSYVNAIVSGISIGLGSFLAYFFISPLSIMFGISASASSAFVLSQRDLGEIIIKAFERNDLRLAEKVSSIYEGDLTEVYKRLVDMKLCNAVVKLPEFRPYTINYLKVDYQKVAECFIELKQVPSRDVVNYLRLIKDKDVNLAEKVGKLALEVSPSPKLVSIMREIEVLKLDYLKYNWDPNVWVNQEVFGYKITSFLGKGGSAYVLVGEKDGVKYAIKIPILMPPSQASSSSYYDFVNEYSQLRELSQRSDNIVKFVDFKMDSVSLKKIFEGDVVAYMKEPPILVMEFMEGGSAKSLMNDNNIFYSDYWCKIVAIIGYQIASALKAIHEMGFVHLDVKPSNILFSKEPGKTGKEVLDNLIRGEVKVKLSDLGSARKKGEKFIQYTPEYCPLDQVIALFTGKGAEYSMDIYSLGATLYTLLTRRPFNPKEIVDAINDAEALYKANKDPLPPLEKAKEVYEKYHENLTLEEVGDKRLADLIKSMTDPDPQKRPSADEVYKRLGEIIKSNEGDNNTG